MSWIALSIALGASAAADAQVDKPRLMLNTGGPVGGIRCLAFSADSARLYAAGSGKVVNVWQLKDDGHGPRAIAADPLRWEIARGQRGRIYALDVAGQSSDVAIAGYSTRSSTGDIVIFDAARQRIRLVLPQARPNVANAAPATGHRQTVVSVDYSLDGRQLVTLSLDREVRLWRDHGGQSIVLEPGGTAQNYVQAAAFLDANRIAFPRADQTQPDVWRLAIADSRTPEEPALVLQQPVFQYGMAAIAVMSDGSQFAVSDHSGEVTLFRNDAALVSRPLNRPRPVEDGRVHKTVASLAYGPRGLLAITTLSDAGGSCWFELWDTLASPPRLVTERRLGRGTGAFASAFSPDGTLLALTRADRRSVTLIPVRPDAGAPLDYERQLEIAGRGRDPGRVLFVGDDGYRIVMDSSTPTRRSLFDLQRLELETWDIRKDDVPQESRPVAASGWRLEPQEVTANQQQILQVYASGSNVPQQTVLLEDTVRQGAYLMHTWLTDEQGHAYGVAVATKTQDGIFLYALPQAGRCRLMRYLRDHRDTITGLSVSHDGKYLASSSQDQTVKIWSLAGLRGVNQTFLREDAWGATFAVEDGRLVVKTALGAGIAAHRDLQVGDVMIQAYYAGANRQPETDSQVILQALATVPLWETFRLRIERNGRPRGEDVLITPGWEPLATLFVDHSDEWALWTPQGVYDASPSGDELFGWQINVARDQDPQYFRAEKFRRELERPAVMRQLLSAGSLQDARLVLGADPARAISDVAADVPRLQLISPQMGADIAAGQNIEVQALVTYPAGRQPNDFRPRLFVNQIDGGAPQVRQVNNDFLYSWSVPPAGERNLIRVRIGESTGDLGALFQDAVVQVTARIAPDRMRVHLFALSAENYPGEDAQPFCNDDAEGVAKLLRAHAGPGGHYDLGEVRVVTDENALEDVSREAVASQVADFRETLDRRGLRADDLLVVFIAGHGFVVDSKFYFVPPDGKLAQTTSSEEQKKKLYEQIGIPWEELRSLAQVPCRKLFLLDTCYSGNVAEAEKQAKRSLRQEQAIVFAATEKDQEAFGLHPELENGLFTGVLLQGCRGAADGVKPDPFDDPTFVPARDGQINLPEVVAYVKQNVLQFSPRRQKPTCTPSELLNFIDIPLF